MPGRVEQVLIALEREGVRCWWYLRTTVDLDLVLHLEPENVQRAIRVHTGWQLAPMAK